MNQELELFLRNFCTWDQSDWAKLLRAAEFAYNSKANATTKVSPIEAGFGRPLTMPDGIRDNASGRGKVWHQGRCLWKRRGTPSKGYSRRGSEG